MRIGGLPFPEQRVTKYAIEIPDGLSLLAFRNPHARILGLDQEHGKIKGRLPGLVLRKIGKSVLEKAFKNIVKASELGADL